MADPGLAKRTIFKSKDFDEAKRKDTLIISVDGQRMLEVLDRRTCRFFQEGSWPRTNLVVGISFASAQSPLVAQRSQAAVRLHRELHL
jgi:hypothetical protein